MPYTGSTRSTSAQAKCALSGPALPGGGGYPCCAIAPAETAASASMEINSVFLFMDSLRQRDLGALAAWCNSSKFTLNPRLEPAQLNALFLGRFSKLLK